MRATSVTRTSVGLISSTIGSPMRWRSRECTVTEAATDRSTKSGSSAKPSPRRIDASSTPYVTALLAAASARLARSRFARYRCEYRFGRVIRLKQDEVDAFIDNCRIEPGTLEHLYPEPIEQAK